MRKGHKVITTLAAFAIMCSAAVPVEASVASEASVQEETYAAVGSYDCAVEITKASGFSVKIPKNVVMSGVAGDNEYEYSVVVSGDIPGYAAITAVPAAKFNFSQNGKADVEAAVTQEKTVFTMADMTANTTSTTGKISVSGLTAGKWNGSFAFTIGYSESAQ